MMVKVCILLLTPPKFFKNAMRNYNLTSIYTFQSSIKCVITKLLINMILKCIREKNYISFIKLIVFYINMKIAKIKVMKNTFNSGI